VIVGISQYAHAGTEGLQNLRYAARDASRLYDTLVKDDPVRWPAANVRLLTDNKATREAVADAVLEFLKRAQRDDLVLIFFSGHGSPDPARPQNTYFVCHDTDPRRLTTTGFPMWEIENALQRDIIQARQVVILADACHSGGILPEGVKDLQMLSVNVIDGLQNLGQRTSRRVVSSCERGERSREDAAWDGGHGAFACALIRGLAGAADSRQHKNSSGDGDGRVDLDEWIRFVRREVGDMTGNAQHIQDVGPLDVTIRDLHGNPAKDR
jgi:uncharacterized caspase-like protein